MHTKPKPVLSKKLNNEELGRVSSSLREIKRDRQDYAARNCLSVEEVTLEMRRLSDLMKADWKLRLAAAQKMMRRAVRLRRVLDGFRKKYPELEIMEDSGE